MVDVHSKLLITGATGQLGRLVVESLLKAVPPSQIVCAVRDPGHGGQLGALGVELRKADYDEPSTLRAALDGIHKVLLISSNELGKREAQHQAVIKSAKSANVKLLAYTSILHADTSLIGLATEHRQTEGLLRSSNVPFALLRNSWYTENYTASIPAALQKGVLLGSAGNGLLSTAMRRDYADAASAVLLSDEEQAGRVYELAGDIPYTLADFAAELSRQSGKHIVYCDLPEAEYETVLIGAGLPKPLATIIAQSDACAATGALFDDSRTLSRLIGRPTTPLQEAIAIAIRA